MIENLWQGVLISVRAPLGRLNEIHSAPPKFFRSCYVNN